MNDSFQLVAEYATPAAPPPVHAPKEKAAKKERVPHRAMTADERLAIRCLAQANYPSASFDKRFAREIQYALNTGEITEGQSGQVWRIFKRYRRQITHPEKERLLAIAETLAAERL